MARDRGNRQGNPPKDDKKGDKKDPKQQTGTQTTWAAFFDDRFDKLEPWGKVIFIGATILYFFKHEKMQEGSIRNWDRIKQLAHLYVDLCREGGGPVSLFFRDHINPPLVAARQRIQQAHQRDRDRRDAWRRRYRRNRFGSLFRFRRPDEEVNPNG